MRLCFVLLLTSAWCISAAEVQPVQALNPRGQMHIAIGEANAVDALKTFVEAEGNFSPGFGSYGVYFWVWDHTQGRLFAPTMEGVPCEHGLGTNGALIPWSRWGAGEVQVTTEVCQVKRPSLVGDVQVVGARVHLLNRGQAESKVRLYVTVRPLGPAGFDVKGIGFSMNGDTLAVAGFPAIVANERPQAGGAATNDAIGEFALAGKLPGEMFVQSAAGNASGAMVYEVSLPPGGKRSFGFVCPVLPHRRVQGHKWDGKSAWAQFDEAKPNAPEGLEVPYPSLRYYRTTEADTLFAEAQAYWEGLSGVVMLKLPDRRWSEAFAAIVGHLVLCLNEGAPDVAVMNYNVFNRDGVYMANIFQKAGQPELAAMAIDYFLRHPFNGRVQPEADNPGQILWIMGEHWRFTRDRKWLERVYPAAEKITAMIRYYRTTPGPHWVWDTSLEFGAALPENQRKELKPGACDGFHPEYTEAFDIAGLRGAVVLAQAAGKTNDMAAWSALAKELAAKYDAQYGRRLAQDYGSYCVLWPTRLYGFDEGPAQAQFAGKGAQEPTSWRYFPLATAHQGLLAGNRDAGWRTLEIHLKHPQMRGWYAFDEGGRSGVGGWNHVRTTWPHGKESVAMPHGWAIAEFILLLRDSLAYEDGERLCLLAGVPSAWFTDPEGMRIKDLPTHFGKLQLTWEYKNGSATLHLDGASPPEGFVLHSPPGLKITITSSSGYKIKAPGRPGSVEVIR